MTARQTGLPQQWLMTDERLRERLWDAIARLPDGQSGIVFRHYGLEDRDRVALARTVAELCRGRRITLAIAGDSALADRIGADLVHNPGSPTALPISLSVHDMGQACEARRREAALVFVSPVHATRSHPGFPPLGAQLASEIAKTANVPAIALGGMTPERFAQLPNGTFHGWAGIDYWVSNFAN